MRHETVKAYPRDVVLETKTNMHLNTAISAVTEAARLQCELGSAAAHAALLEILARLEAVKAM